MTKRRKYKQSNQLNHFDDGGPLDWSNPFAGGMKGGLGKTLVGVAGQAGGIAGNAISGGLSSGAGNAIGALGDVASAIPGPWGAVASAGLKVIGGLTNAAFGTKTNTEELNKANSGTLQLNSFNSTATSFDNLDTQGPAVSDIGKVYSGGWFSKNKARKKQKALETQRLTALDYAQGNIENNIENIQQNQLDTMVTNYAAHGGKIYIKPENRGKWHHAFDEGLNTNGADFTNDTMYIENGGTHEQNPNEGVQVGVDDQGIPNLVEEGELIYNDYVYSARTKVPKSFKEKYKLSGDKLTFAEAAKKLQKESEERPNDPISKNGLNASMAALAMEQENIRENMQNKQKNNQFAIGGPFANMPSAFAYMSKVAKDTLPRSAQQENLYPHYGYVSTAGTFPTNSIKQPKKYKVSKAKTTNTKVEPINTKAETAPKIPIYQGPNLADLADTSGMNLNKIDLPQELKNKTFVKDDSSKDDSSYGLDYLRYAPVLGSMVGLGQSLMSKPDYSNADKIETAAQRVSDFTPVKSTPLGNHLTYNPFDINAATNKLSASASATRRALTNISGGNRANIQAGLLATDYNTQGQLGDLFRKSIEYNNQRQAQIEEFNRATNQYNNQSDLQAQLANQEAHFKAGQYGLSGITQAASMREAIDANRAAALNANLTGLFENLGGIGKEEYTRNMLESNPFLLYNMDRSGNISYKSRAKGGRINRNKKG